MDSNDKLRVLIAGGGTGGHVIPALAIARALQKAYGAEVEFVGTSRGIENKLVPAAGYKLHLVNVGALKNVSLLTRAKTMFDLPRAVMSAGKLLRAFKPHVVVGVGGYASGPAMMAAVLKGVPTLAFEPNVVPGFANKVVGKRVSAAAVHFPETAKFFRNANVTGVPVRAEFFALPGKTSSQPTLLVTGGSQGARALNRVMVEALPQINQRLPELRIIHQTGEKELPEVQAGYEKAGVLAEVSAFIQDMPAAFAKADVLLCRSGASTVAEITAAGKVAIFVPFPQSADDHQKRNAEALSTKDAAVLIEQKDLAAEKLVGALVSILKEPERLKRMSAASKAMSHPGAAEEIAAMVADLAKN
jgi:UDP-N-acetylglucosamine--N-acetylmuramyl-(pentapeptide) pyrophosphoryl-undecaprenol N-acetylglucosamine transferase